MKRLSSFLFWCFLFLGVCFGLDQLLVRVEMPVPVLAEARTFYVDFRTRLVNLAQRVAEGQPPAGTEKTPPRPPKHESARSKAIELTLAASEEEEISPATTKPFSPSTEGSPRYLYVDGKGALLFSDRLEDIPAAYRKEAQFLDR
jgi:hypothetical protein